MVSSAKPSQRIICDALCLVEYKGVTYRAIIQNLSLSGALIRFESAIPAAAVGDECGLLLCSDPDLCPIRYICRVVRRDQDQIGIEFIEIGSSECL